MLIQANSLSIPLKDKTVQCVVTSPPYFNLRNYKEDEQIGLEDTPEEYISNIAMVFREVKRVLKDDGTVFLNLGDVYRNKQLLGIPWRIALALQADNWILRSDIIWQKPDPTPSSVVDRPTVSHEYIFMFSKSMNYYYDYEAIKEPAIWAADRRADKGRIGYEGKRKGEEGTGQKSFVSIDSSGRNKRTVWTIPTYHFPGAHFATMPPKLVEPCIMAGCPVYETVLDPFVGSGTTVMVAEQWKRIGIGIDLSREYLDIAKKRRKLNQLEMFP